MDNLEEIDKFLKTCNLPRLNHDETENLNKPIMSKDTESLIKHLPTKESPGPDGFTREYYQTLKEKLVSILPKLFKRRGEATLPFYEARITLILKSEKDTTRKEYYRPIFMMNINVKF